MKKFTKLQLNKKTIAKLNDAQLTTVKGGNKGKIDPPTIIVNCTTPTATVINTRIG